MMFLAHLFNHTKLGKTSLEDVIGIMGHQIRALGHKCIWDPQNDAREDGTYDLKFVIAEQGYNIIVEGFTETVIKIIKDAYDTGARFICVATEEPTPKGFNHGISLEMRDRQKMFPEAAKYFDGILHLVPGKHVTDWYSQFAPSFQCELGYAPSLVRQEVNSNPRHDFGFFGSLSKRRLSLLKRLGRRTSNPFAIKVVADFPNQTERDKVMQDCKVILQLRKFESMGLVSTSRCNTALNIGRPVVAEAHAYSKPWDEIVTFAKDEQDFFVKAITTAGIWRGVHYAQFSKFKEKLSPQICVGFALDQIFAYSKTRKAA